MTTICITHPDSNYVADIATPLRQLFEGFGGSGWNVVVIDDPDFARLVRGFTYAERQEDPERAAEWLAATMSRTSPLTPSGFLSEGVPWVRPSSICRSRARSLSPTAILSMG